MKPTIVTWLFCVVLLVGSGVWIGSRASGQSQSQSQPQPINQTLYNQIYEHGKLAMVREIAACTIEEAHKDLCSIPCASDEDCVRKNGKGDH